MNNTKLMFGLGELKHFINNSLKLSYDKNDLTGFELIAPLMKAASHNTYIEKTDKTVLQSSVLSILSKPKVLTIFMPN